VENLFLDLETKRCHPSKTILHVEDASETVENITFVILRQQTRQTE